MRVVILEPAMDDLRAGRRFYACQGGRDMGRRFFETLSETIGSLSEHGGIHVRKFGFHRALAAKFPYSVYYDIEGDTVRVHAVVDNRRNPAWVEDRVAGAGTHAKVQRHGDGEEAWCVRERNAPGYGAGSQEARRPVIYLETSFVSALTGRMASDPRKAAMQEASRKWWEEEGEKWHPVVSEAVRDEALDGDSDAVAKRLEFIDGFETLGIDEKAVALADVLVRENNLPEKCRTDALHVALAAIRRADLLLTWNCRHIANSETVPKLAATLVRAGYMRARHWRRRRSDWRSEVMNNPVFEMDDEFFEKEIMAPRRRLWERGGGTLHGVCEYLRKRHAERMARRVAGEPQNGQTTKLANGETDLARKGAEGDAV